MKDSIAIIGAGNLGSAIARGLSEAGLLDKFEVIASRRNLEAIKDLEKIGIQITSDNLQAVKDSRIIILAVQPKQVGRLIDSFSSALDADRHILVSVVTGITLKDIHEMAGPEFTVVRAMPNTAIALRQSMTCLATENAQDEALGTVQTIFDAVGRTMIINERLMQAATVLGACGIAFFLRFIRAASQGGTEVGFHAEEAQLIASQTALGAASILLDSDSHPEEAIDKVTTPMGCTIAGLNEMEHHGLSSALIKGIITSYKKIENIT